MAKFVYNNINNASTSHTLFEFNCKYHCRVFFEDKTNSHLRSHSTNKLVEGLRKLMKICYQNLLYTQELQTRAHNKGIKSCSYTPSKKIWLNSKYIKTKQNQKFENKFFGPFQVFYIIKKQVYKL